ncbi:unnamed protein product [Arabis nemorensis]|uniref:Uncharacterized protein n=1 Tax=Arabis nemorensis TaxID=586526 RepID=A0A565CV80_9BRAS|nr:unnamed protein product [Arabis nemorensis]
MSKSEIKEETRSLERGMSFLHQTPDVSSFSRIKLDDAGLGNHFGESKWKLTKGNLVMVRGKKEVSLYVTQATLCEEEVNIANAYMELWHGGSPYKREGSKYPRSNEIPP